MDSDRLRTEVYSFASFLVSHLALCVWLLWVFVPEEVLHSWGITYYPDKWWAVALPIYLIPLAVFVLCSYNALNMMATCPLDSAAWPHSGSMHGFDVAMRTMNQHIFSSQGKSKP
eukprot:g13230.t1